MPRPLSWAHRIPEIRRSVANSVRTHFDRRALELLFQIQPRAAGRLMAMLTRSAPLGNAHLVEKEVLHRFVCAMGDAEDPAEAYAHYKGGKATVSRRKPRVLVRKELIEEGSFESLPKNVKLSRGRLEVSFGSKMEAYESIATFLGAVENQPDEFEELYVPGSTAAQESQRLRAETDDLRRMFEGLRQMEANRDKKLH